MKMCSRDSLAGLRGAGAVGRILPWVALVVTGLFGAGYIASSWSFVFDLIANLSYLAVWPLAGILVVAALVRRRWLALATCSAILVASIPLAAPLVSGTPTPAEDLSTVSLLVSNVQGKETAWQRLHSLIRSRRPDIVVLVEAEPPVMQRVLADETLLSEYPFAVIPKRGLAWPIIMLSRFPLKPVKPAADSDRYKFLFSFRRASIVSLPFGDAILTAEHPPSPRTRRSWIEGNEQLLLLSELIRQHFEKTGLPVVVAGDFNSTPSGYRTRLLRDRAGLHGDPLGIIPRGTWPSNFPAFWRLPLDRVWASTGLAFISREVLADIGSDHRPVIVRFTAAKPN
jgi:endonuclease/exonuclease/phosphatase (EEP) superfamily protein YafD